METFQTPKTINKYKINEFLVLGGGGEGEGWVGVWVGRTGVDGSYFPLNGAPCFIIFLVWGQPLALFVTIWTSRSTSLATCAEMFRLACATCLFERLLVGTHA